MSKTIIRLLIIICLLCAGIFTFAQNSPTLNVTASYEPTSDVYFGETEVTISLEFVGESGDCPILESTDPVDVALVIDVSGSMAGEKIDSAKLAAQTFVDVMNVRDGDPSSDQIGIVSFSSNAQIQIPLTRVRADIDTAIFGLGVGGGTDIVGGLNAGSQVLNDPTQQNTLYNANPVMVLLSDGQQGVAQVTAAAEQAKATGIRIITIGLGSDVSTETMIAAASRPEDYLQAQSATQLQDIFRQVASQIIQSTAANDVRVNFQYIRDNFELIPNSTNPPAVVTGDILSWVFSEVKDSKPQMVSFRVRPLKEGTHSVGQLVDSRYRLCEQDEPELPLNIALSVNSQLPPPTPVPTFTPTPLPTSTPLPPPPLPSTDVINQSNQARGDHAMPIMSLLAYCLDFFKILPWIILLFIAALIVWWLFRATGKPKEERSSWLCLLAKFVLFAWTGFALWLLSLPFYATVCPKQDVVYFWQSNLSDLDGATGIYMSPFQSGVVDSVDGINAQGCVGCHTVSANSNRIAAIRGPVQNSTLIVFDSTGKPLPITPIRANFASISPNGDQVAIADIDGDISIVTIGTGKVTKLSGADTPNMVETMPSWGINDRIAYVVTNQQTPIYDDGTNLTTPSDIYTISVTGNDPIAVAGASGNGAFNYYPAFSPNAEWIAFTAHNNTETYTDPQAQIFVVSANDTGASPIAIAGNRDENGLDFPNATNSYPSWSPDGRILTFNTKRNDTSNSDIYWAEVNADGNTGLASPLAGADDENVFELMSAWGAPPATLNPLARLLKLLPVLLPILPLLGLAWILCQKEPQPKFVGGRDKVKRFTMHGEPLAPKLEDFSIKWETQPAMIIGLGRTGRWVVTHLKKSLLDAGEEKIPDKIRLLVVDTGDFEKLNQGYQQNPVSIAGVELDNKTEVLELKDNLHELLQSNLGNHREYKDWVDVGRVKSLNTDLSQGGLRERVLARLGLIHQMQTSPDNLWTRLKQMATAVQDNKRIRVIIVGDTYGDIGSAALMDVAVLARKAGQEISPNMAFEVHAYIATQFEDATERLNTAATLRELHRFQLSDSKPFAMYYGNVIDSVDGNGQPITKTMNFAHNDIVTDSLQLYPVSHYVGDFYNAEPKYSIYPQMADVIISRLDKGNAIQAIGQMYSDERNTHNRIRQSSGTLLFASEGSYQVRLPFVDIIKVIRSRYMQEVVRRFVEPDLQNSAYLGTVETAEQFAQDVIVGVFSNQELRELDSVLVMIIDQSSPADILPYVKDSEDRIVSIIRGRLREALSLILNGTQDVPNMMIARSGKVVKATRFLEVYPQESKTIRSYLSGLMDDRNGGEAAENIHTALEESEKLANTYLQKLQAFAQSLGIDTTDDDTLLGKVNQLPTRIDNVRDELNQLQGVREYIWTDTDGNPLEEKWYIDYIFPPLEEVGKSRPNRVQETMGLFYWNVDSETVGLSFQTPDGKVAIHPTNISELYDKLFELGTAYCTQIGLSENLDSVLSSYGLPRDSYYVEGMRDRLLNRSRTPLQFDETQARDYEYHAILASNSVSGIPQLQQAILDTANIQQNNQLIQMKATDPFTVYLKQRRAIIPFEAITPLEVTRTAYSQEYGLNNQQPNSNPKLTAVYEAEAYALKLERRFSRELRTRPDITHPYVMMGLTEPKRAQMFLLSIAAGEIEVTGPRPGTNDEYDVLLIDNDDEYAIEVNRQNDNQALHPLVRAYHSFVFDKSKISDSLVVEREKRFVTDEFLPDIWTDWLNTDHQDLLDEVKGDALNEPIIRDMVNFARLLTVDFRRRSEQDS